MKPSSAVRYWSSAPAGSYILSSRINNGIYIFNRLRFAADGSLNTATTPSRLTLAAIFMGNILLGAVLTGILFLTFLFLLFTGLRKRRRKPIYVSLLLLSLALGAGAWTGYLFASKAYNKAKNVKLDNPFKARTGSEIYEAMFGAPQQNCVQVINKRDQVVPRLDCCIWLEFSTCPAELKRIIYQEPYKASIVAVSDTAAYIPDYSPRPEWFRPAIMEDSIFMLRHYNPDNPNRNQILLFSRDSTHAFYCDMAD